MLGLAAQIEPFRDQADHRIPGIGIDLGGIGVVEADDVAGKADHRRVEAVADAEVGHVVLPRELGGADHALETPGAEPARHEYGVHVLQRVAAVALKLFGVHVAHVHLGAVLDPGVDDGFGQRLVGVEEVEVLADDGDLDGALGVLQRLGNPSPLAQVGTRAIASELLDHDVVQGLFVEQHRNLVDRRRVGQRDHRTLLDAGEQGDLAAHVVGERLGGAADQHVRLQADGAQVAHRVLRRLGLDLACGL